MSSSIEQNFGFDSLGFLIHHNLFLCVVHCQKKSLSSPKTPSIISLDFSNSHVKII